MTRKRITAAEYPKNMPPAFIRFPECSIGPYPDEVLLKFLRDSKQYFLNCRLNFSSIDPDEEQLQKVEKLLSDTFLNPSVISFRSPSFASEKILKTTSVRNCDKVEICIKKDPKCTKDTFMDWIHWKQNQSGSRRHLILDRWWFDVVAVQEMLQDLKHVSFVTYSHYCRNKLASLF
ncbi:hypothetical protein Ddc_14956 [Ditylenchus destructor]|nr:hypothetical protein Ddc_14956 [Ditylenchus destructor]